jgi:nucleoside-triphosphatase THEP1
MQATELKPHWLIIDEIGPIELRGEGLEPQVSQILKEYPRTRKNRLILVIRDQLLEKVLEHYNLSETARIHDSFLDIV